MSNPVIVTFAMLHPGYFTILVVAGLAALCYCWHVFTR